MKITFDNLALSSMVLWLDHLLIKKGEAYTNHSGVFYKMDSLYNGYHAYSTPYKPFVYDISNEGPNVPTGLYLNGNFITTGQSGFASLDYRNGRAYFTSALPAGSVLSGNYAVKEYSVELTNRGEAELLFETKVDLRPKVNRPATGIYSNELTYPIIFLKKKSSHNEGFAFGGEDNTVIDVTAVIFTDSQFNLDSTLGIMRDTKNTYIPLLSADEQPFNILGDFRNGVLNYTGLTHNRVGYGSGIFIEEAQEIQFDRVGQIEANKINPDVFFGMVDFKISKNRFPRQ